MQVRFKPDLQAKIDSWQLKPDARRLNWLRMFAGYFEELAQSRGMLHSRYDDLKSGRVKVVPGDEVIGRLREKRAARRSQAGA